MNAGRARAWLRLGGFALALALAAGAGAGCLVYLDPKCDDQIRNGSETDVDCGGNCRPCSTGHPCHKGADCESGTCADLCVPPPCENGVQDGTETDVDCGGDACRKCAGGRRCQADRDCFGGRCDAASQTCRSLRTVSFAAPVSYPAGFKTYVLLAGDVNRDGRLDLVALNEQGSSVSTFLGRGDGTFVRVEPEFPTGAYPTGGAIVDLDRDGNLDVVTANFHGNSVSVLLGNGDGTFRAFNDYPTVGGAETSNLAVGDLNGDGYPDVVASNPKSGSLSLFLARPDGTLPPAVNVLVGVLGASAPDAVVIADFDRDGKNDLAIMDAGTRRTIVRRGNGDGSFGPEVDYPAVGSLLAADVNGDGRLDLVAVDRGTNLVTVLLGRGDGTFRDPLQSTTGDGTGPFTAAVGDFNQDGVADLVTSNFDAPEATVLLGVGDGRFEAPIDGGVTGPLSYGSVAADLDGDGRPDFATCNAGSNDVIVILNTSH